jgi:hypothetical protein
MPKYNKAMGVVLDYFKMQGFNKQESYLIGILMAKTMKMKSLCSAL